MDVYVDDKGKSILKEKKTTNNTNSYNSESHLSQAEQNRKVCANFNEIKNITRQGYALSPMHPAARCGVDAPDLPNVLFSTVNIELFLRSAETSPASACGTNPSFTLVHVWVRVTCKF